MIGRRLFPFGKGYFQGRTVSFREGIAQNRENLSLFVYWVPAVSSLYVEMAEMVDSFWWALGGDTQIDIPPKKINMSHEKGPF